MSKSAVASKSKCALVANVMLGLLTVFAKIPEELKLVGTLVFSCGLIISLAAWHRAHHEELQKTENHELSAQEIWDRLVELQKQGWEFLGRWHRPSVKKPVREVTEWAAEARRFVGEHFGLKEIRAMNDPLAKLPIFGEPPESQDAYRALTQCEMALRTIITERG